MFARILLALAGLGLVALPFPAPAFADSDANVPTLVVRISSIDDLLEDGKFLSKLSGQEADMKNFDEHVKKALPNGLKGVDTGKPLGLYAKLDPGGNPMDSTAVALIPIKDEKAFLGLLSDLHQEPKKEEGDIYSLSVEKIPFPVYFRFGDGYAYVTVRDKEPIAKGKVLDLSKIFPAGPAATISLIFRIDQIPDGFKQIGIGQLELRLSELEEKKPAGQSDAQHALQVQAVKELAKQLTAIIRDGTQFEVALNVDRKAHQLATEWSLAGKAGSELAKEIAAVGTGKSQFAKLTSDDDAINVLVRHTLPASVQQALASGFDQIVKDELKKESDAAKREALGKLLQALGPTIKAGEIDAAVSFRGPSGNQQFAFVAALGLKDGEGVEKSLRDIVKDLPAGDVEKKLKVDAESFNGVKIHRIDVVEGLDAKTKKVLGPNPAYFALRGNAAFLAAGDGGLEALKQALGLEPSDAPPLKFNLSASRLGPLMDKEKNKRDPGEVSREVFGQAGRGDKVHITFNGGPAAKFRIEADADALKFFALAGKAAGHPRSASP
jgi:hypothetical protein